MTAASLPTTAELVAALDQKRLIPLGDSLSRLLKDHGAESLVPSLVAAYPLIRNAAGRNAILFWLTRFSRTHTEVVELAQSALGDPAYMPRAQATAILAYSQRLDAIPHLKPLLTHSDAKTQANAAAAIDAIEHQNHHYWLDRKHSGDMNWIVNAGDQCPRSAAPN